MSAFGVNLDTLMLQQRAAYPELGVPRVLLVLVRALERSGALTADGVFRVPVRRRRRAHRCACALCACLPRLAASLSR